MIDSASPVIAQVIEAETVFVWIDNGEEILFEEHELGGGYFAFEDGILHALSVVEAGFGDLAESFFAAGG